MPFKAIKSNLFAKNTVVERTADAFLKHGQFTQSLMYQTVEYWNNPPSFADELKYVDGLENRLTVYPIGNVDAVSHWVRINWGAFDRDDVMTRDFQPKTQVPGGIGTNRPGVGGFSHKEMPIHEIRKRGWTRIIVFKFEDKLVAAAQRAIEKGLKNE